MKSQKKLMKFIKKCTNIQNKIVYTYSKEKVTLVAFSHFFLLMQITEKNCFFSQIELYFTLYNYDVTKEKNCGRINTYDAAIYGNKRTV